MAVKKKAQPQLVRIKLIRSLIGREERVRATVKGLGLRRINSTVVREKRPEIMGMIRKIDYMLEVTEVVNDNAK